MNIPMRSVSTMAMIHSGAHFLFSLANRTCLTAVRFIHKRYLDTFALAFVFQILLYFAKAPVREFLIDVFPSFLFRVSLYPFGITDIHIRNALVDAPIYKRFGGFVKGIPQLSFTFRKDIPLRQLVFLPLPRAFFALALKFLQFSKFLVAKTVDTAKFPT